MTTPISNENDDNKKLPNFSSVVQDSGYQVDLDKRNNSDRCRNQTWLVKRHYDFMDDGKIALVRLTLEPRIHQPSLELPFQQPSRPSPRHVLQFISVARFQPPLNPARAQEFHERLTTLDHVQLIRRLPSRSEIERHRAKFETLMVTPEHARTVQQLNRLTSTMRHVAAMTSYENLVIGFFVGVTISVTLSGDSVIDHGILQQAHQEFLKARQYLLQTCDVFHVKIIPLKKKDILKLWFWNDAAPRYHVILKGPPSVLERYLRPIKVPTRLVAVDLPSQDHVPVGYQVGHDPNDPRVSRGFAPLPRVGPIIVTTGGTRTIRIGMLQRLAVELSKDHDHVIILDLNHEFSGLARFLSQHAIHHNNFPSFRILRVGTNFFMNPCQVMLPPSIKQDDERIQYQADVIARMIIAATRPWKGLEWKESLSMALKNYLNEEREVKGHDTSITFDDVHRMLEDLSRVGDVYVDVTNLESVRHVIARLATLDALNHRYFTGEHAPSLMDARMIIFQPDMHHPIEIKRLCAYYVLHFFTQVASDPQLSFLGGKSKISSTKKMKKKIAFIVSPASSLFITAADRRSTAALTQLQRDVIMPFFDDLLAQGVTLVLADASYTMLPAAFAAASDAVFLRAHDAVDASAIVKRMGLHVHVKLRERHLRPEDLVLQLMDDEAFLLRQDLMIPQYVKLTPLRPIITETKPIAELVSSLSDVTTELTSATIRGLPLARFTSTLYAVLMTVLEQLHHESFMSRAALLTVLKTRHPGINDTTVLKDIQKLPFVLITHRGGTETYQLTNKGLDFLQSQRELVSSLPSPYTEEEFNTVAMLITRWVRLRDEGKLSPSALSIEQLLTIYQRLIQTLSFIGDIPWYHVHHCFRIMHQVTATTTNLRTSTQDAESPMLLQLLLRHCDELVAEVSVAMRDPARKHRLTEVYHLNDEELDVATSFQPSSPSPSPPETMMTTPSDVKGTSNLETPPSQDIHEDTHDINPDNDDDSFWEWLTSTPPQTEHEHNKKIIFEHEGVEERLPVQEEQESRITRLIDASSQNHDHPIAMKEIRNTENSIIEPVITNSPVHDRETEVELEKETNENVVTSSEDDDLTQWFNLEEWDELLLGDDNLEEKDEQEDRNKPRE